MCFDCYSRYQPVKYGNIQEAEHATCNMQHIFAHFNRIIFVFGKLNLLQYLYIFCVRHE